MDESHHSGSSPEKLFWRVMVSDTYSAGNGLSDFEMEALGMTPGFSDTNSNLIPDDFETANSGRVSVFPPVLATKMPRLKTQAEPLFLWNDTGTAVNYTVTVNGAEVPVYSHLDSLTGGVTDAWEEISTTGTKLATVSNANDAFEAAPFSGFTFPFYGQNYSKVFVSSNGLLSFGGGITSYSNTQLPDYSAPPGIIAVLWDDLDTQDANNSGEVLYKQESDRFIIQYQDVTVQNHADTLTFQAVLFADGRIQLRYKTINGTTTSATVGVQNQTKDDGLEILYNAAYVASGLTIEIAPVSEFLKLSPTLGSVPAHSSFSLDAVFDSFRLAPGVYYAQVEVSHDAPTPSPIKIPARLEVENVPGTVALTSPAEGFSILEGKPVRFYAVATDPEGIARVEFYYDSVKFGEDLRSSYSFSSASIPAGTHNITARMVDIFGQTVDSPQRTLTIIADTDRDGIPNDWEIANGLDPNFQGDATLDADSDGYTNFEEYTLGKNPKVAEDSDGDGIPDGIERKLVIPLGGSSYRSFDLSKMDTDNNGINDGDEDYDRDGLTTLQEILAGTDSNKTDTDKDGVNDGKEIELGTDPLIHDAWFDALGVARDSDGDGLSDIFEIMIGTNPFNADTNGNGMNDGDELDAGGSPSAPGSAPSPIPPPVTGPEPPADAPPQPPAPLSPVGYEILVESKTVSFPKHGFESFQTLDPPRRYLKRDSSQSFRGGCPESRPLGVTGQRSTTVDELTGAETTVGDTFVNTAGDVQSAVRKAGSNNLSSYDDPPNRNSDCTGKVSYFTVLSDENTTPQMVTNGKSKLEAFEGGEALQTGTAFAYRNVHANELLFDYKKTQFKFKWDSEVGEEDRYALTYLVVFTPEDDPDTTEDESEEKEVVRTIEWDGQSAESALYILDPDTEKPGADGNYSLLPVEIKARKKGESISDESLLVKTGDTLEFGINRDSLDEEKAYADLIHWEYRQRQLDGEYTEWSQFDPPQTGSKFEHLTESGGIFQVKAVFDGNNTFYYARGQDEKVGTFSYGPGLKGEPDSIGVCDEQIQIDICREAQSYYGSEEYEAQRVVPAQYGFSEYPNSGLSIIRCNIFVAHRACAAGATVPAINGIRGSYPPLANEWAAVEATASFPSPPNPWYIPKWPLEGGIWLPGGTNTFPQPGWIIAHPNPGDSGHVAITDYDGEGIGAGVSGTVNKLYIDFWDGTSRMRSYNPQW